LFFTTPVASQEAVSTYVPYIPVAIFDVRTFKDVVVYIDTTGAVVIEPQFEYGEIFHDGLALVKINGKYGYIDASGKIRIPAIYDRAWKFSEGYGIVQVDKKMGYIDTAGKVVIPLIFDNAEYFHEGMAWYTIGDKRGFIDKTGKAVVAPTYSLTRSFSEGLAAVKVPEGKWGYIDKTGTMVIAPRFEGYTIKDISDFSNGLAFVQLGEEIIDYWVVINKSGNIVMDFRTRGPKIEGEYFTIEKGRYTSIGLNYTDFPKVNGFCEGYAVVNGDLWRGFISQNGHVTQPKFNIPNPVLGTDHSYPLEIRDFHEGLAAVKVNDKWGYIRTDGKLATAPQYEAVGDFGFYGKGITWVKLNGKYIIRTRNKIILDQAKVKWDSQERKIVTD
jgi:hypothetical protein